MGVHDADYVDAYYGPPVWKKEATASPRSLADLRNEATALVLALKSLKPSASAPQIERLRHEYLAKQLRAMIFRAQLIEGRKESFETESRALYDSVAPARAVAQFEETLGELESVLPGEGTIVERYDAFRKRFYIPSDKIDVTFKTAIAECRERTLARIELPPNENFTVEYVKGKSWSAYNWYKGGFQSVIQVNTELPIEIDRVIDLACHEGYPGHHVYNVLLEKELTRGRNWVEFSVYPLFSPQSLIAEGTANYGIDVAFPGDERMKFERDSIFPLAGIDPSLAPQYRRVQRLVAKLSYASNEAARQYLEGRIDANAAAAWLEKYGLYSPERAKQRVRFIDQYRAYVINYNHGRDLVARYVESRVGAGNARRRWDVFKRLLASPRLPGSLN
jgi:hypothetical protein